MTVEIILDFAQKKSVLQIHISSFLKLLTFSSHESFLLKSYRNLDEIRILTNMWRIKYQYWITALLSQSVQWCCRNHNQWSSYRLFYFCDCNRLQHICFNEFDSNKIIFYQPNYLCNTLSTLVANWYWVSLSPSCRFYN